MAFQTKVDPYEFMKHALKRIGFNVVGGNVYTPRDNVVAVLQRTHIEFPGYLRELASVSFEVNENGAVSFKDDLVTARRLVRFIERHAPSIDAAVKVVSQTTEPSFIADLLARLNLLEGVTAYLSKGPSLTKWDITTEFHLKIKPANLDSFTVAFWANLIAEDGKKVVPSLAIYLKPYDNVKLTKENVAQVDAIMAELAKQFSSLDPVPLHGMSVFYFKYGQQALETIPLIVEAYLDLLDKHKV